MTPAARHSGPARHDHAVTHRSLTVTIWVAAAIAAVLTVLTGWAATISVTTAVATAGPLVIAAGAAAAAREARRELRATHVPDLDAANQRENNIAAH